MTTTDPERPPGRSWTQGERFMTKPTSNSPKTAPTSDTKTTTGSPAAGKPAITPASAVKIVPAAEKVPFPSPLPKTWADIQVGSLVIAEEALEYGWWHAVVTEVHGDLLTIRWRDYPKQAATKRNRKDVALLYAGD